MSISVVIADDHPLVLKGLESMLEGDSEFHIVARCVNGEEAVEAAQRLRPDLLILDLNMPRKDGLTVLRELAQARLPTRVVLLVAELSKGEALEAMRLGARGIILKELSPQQLIRCLRTVNAGKQWFENRTLGAVVEDLLARQVGMREAAAILTPREIEVSRMVASGLRNRDIAERLHVTEGTIKLHLHNIYEKLNIKSRVELTRYALNKGLADG